MIGHKFIILLSMICFGVLSNAAIINGKTYNKFAGKTVNLIEYTDYITYEYNIIASTIINEEGKFILTANFEKTKQALVQIEDLIGIIFLDPNQTYSIYFPPTSEDGTYKLTRNYVNLIFDSIPKNDINGLILEFDRKVDQFFQDNMGLIGSPLYKTKLDTLKKKLKLDYAKLEDAYFKKYIKYTIGSLDLIALAKNQHINRLSNYNVYLANKYVDHKNVAYMTFFNQFYEKDFLTPSVSTSSFTNKIIESINTKASYYELDTLLARDYFFKNKKVRTLAMLTNLFELYNDKRFVKENILNVLKEIKDSNDNEMGVLAQNVFSKLTKMQIGSIAIDFTLNDKNNKPITLSDFEGKYIYLNFWASWSKESQAEMAMLPVFQEKYGKHVEFVSINIDLKKSKFDNYIAAHQQDKWTHLYYGGNTNLLDDYGVNSIPFYILIGPNGVVIQNPAQSPSPNGSYISIDKTFFDINKKLTKKKRWNIGGK